MNSLCHPSTNPAAPAPRPSGNAPPRQAAFFPGEATLHRRSQIIHHGWDDFLTDYEQHHRKTLDPLRTGTSATVQSFLRCGDLSAGFTRLQCPDCGHERLLAFTCKGRHFCPACHQRRTRTIGEWIATAVCHEVPHRQFVFTIPKVLRGIFRKRRHLLTHLFHTATSTLQDAFRTRLGLPHGRIGAIAGVHTSQEKITWNATSKTVIYRSKRHHTTRRNFEIFKAHDFIAAAIDHIPPKGQQTVRYYGIYSNKSRGQSSPIPDRIIRPSQPKPPPENPTPFQILLIPAPPKRRARDMRPLWRDLILKVWGGDPLLCPCCNGTMKVTGTMIRREEIEFFLRLHGLWQGIIHLPRPPPPPFDIETMEPIEPPWQAIKEWIPDAPLWPCRLQDPPPDLVFIIRRLNAAGAFPTTNLISLGSTRKETPPAQSQTRSTKPPPGSPKKSRSVTAAP